MNRRRFLAASAWTASAWAATVAAARASLAAAGAADSRLGMCTFSCHQHWKAVAAGQAGRGFTDAAGFYRYARDLGAEGVQTPLKGTDPRALRELVEQTGGYYEGELALPLKEADVAAFEEEVRNTRAAGATVARAVFTTGRRYETFDTLEEFRAFHRQAERSLALVEPVARRHGLKIAIENHKDLTTAELVALMKGLSSEWVGVLVDTGNNIALLEEPHGVVEALAPFAFSMHLKDMAVQPSPDGFLLSEVPLGTGMLDLGRMVAAVRKANPGIVVNLEMATRDPLPIPCLTDRYFVSFPERKATHLAAALRLVEENPPPAVPAVRGKPLAEVLAEEERNNRDGLGWMHRELGV